MISQCNETKNVALNHQILWKSFSLLQLNEISFPGFKSSNHVTLSYMYTVEQLSVALGKQCDCHPIPPQPPSFIKTDDCAVVLCRFPLDFCLQGMTTKRLKDRVRLSKESLNPKPRNTRFLPRTWHLQNMIFGQNTFTTKYKSTPPTQNYQVQNRVAFQ